MPKACIKRLAWARRILTCCQMECSSQSVDAAVVNIFLSCKGSKIYCSRSGTNIITTVNTAVSSRAWGAVAAVSISIVERSGKHANHPLHTIRSASFLLACDGRLS